MKRKEETFDDLFNTIYYYKLTNIKVDETAEYYFQPKYNEFPDSVVFEYDELIEDLQELSEMFGDWLIEDYDGLVPSDFDIELIDEPEQEINEGPKKVDPDYQLILDFLNRNKN